MSYDLSSQVIDTTYIKTDTEGEGPFLFYYSASYDPSSYEGIIGIALYKYDTDTLIFTEV